MKTLRNYFHLTNNEKLSITATVHITASTSVETTNTSAQSALFSNSNFMNKILEALKAVDMQENETSTASFGITPYYNYSANTNQGRLIGFAEINFLQIKSSNIENILKWIEPAVSQRQEPTKRTTFTSVCEIV
jgi:uncharacterized protein YggE